MQISRTNAAVTPHFADGMAVWAFILVPHTALLFEQRGHFHRNEIRTMRITEQDRVAARAEREQHAPRMSEEAKRKLKEQNEHDRTNKSAEERVLAWFLRLPKDVSTMRYVLRKIFPLVSAVVVRTKYPDYGDRFNLDRAARKLLAGLDSGLVPTAENIVQQIAFMSELTPYEIRMSDEAFVIELLKQANTKHRPRVPATQKRRRASSRAKILVWASPLESVA